MSTLNLIDLKVAELNGEGFSDNEIARAIGISRSTVIRKRKKMNISNADPKNKKDKPCKCIQCNKVFYVRRNEFKKCMCNDCEYDFNNLQLEEKKGGK